MNDLLTVSPSFRGWQHRNTPHLASIKPLSAGCEAWSVQPAVSHTGDFWNTNCVQVFAIISFGGRHGAPYILERLSEALARHLRGIDDAGDHVEREKVRFHTLNRETGNRVRSRYVDDETGKPVEEDDEVKGYERDEGRLRHAGG